MFSSNTFLFHSFSFTGTEMETLKPEIKWRIISDFYQKKIAKSKHYTVNFFWENMVLSGTDTSSETGHRCKEVNLAQKRSRAPSETEKSAGNSLETNNEK